MSFGGLLIHTATVVRPARTADDYGGAKANNQGIYTAMPCRLSEESGREAIMRGKVDGHEYSHRLFYETTYTILDQDTVTVNSQQYGVVAVLNYADSTADHHREALLVRYE